MTRLDLTAVVLNWRTPELTLRARASLLDDGVAAGRVLLVDNGSGDDSLAVFAARAHGSPVLALGHNVGFARANNRAVEALPARCYLFVNADAHVHRPGSIAALATAVARPDVDIAVPRLRNPDLTLQPNVVPLPAPLPEIVRASGLSRLVPNRWQPQLGTHWDHARSRAIQAADGAVLAVDAAAFDAVGGFDERTFMYGEDHALFAALARRRGAGCAWFVSEAEFIHRGGAASAQRWDGPSRAERAARARGSLLLGEEARPAAGVALGAMLLGAGARALAFRLGGARSRATEQAAGFRGYRSAIVERLRRPARPGLK